MQDDTTPKIHIDSDWKAEAQAEKDRLAAEEQDDTDAGADGSPRGGLPEADFRALVGVLASQAIMGLGAMADPKTSRVVIDLEGAKFAIDLLGVVEEKTKDNLTDEETKELGQVLAELRKRFVQVTQLGAQNAIAGEGGDVPQVEPG